MLLARYDDAILCVPPRLLAATAAAVNSWARLAWTGPDRCDEEDELPESLGRCGRVVGPMSPSCGPMCPSCGADVADACTWPCRLDGDVYVVSRTFIGDMFALLQTYAAYKPTTRLLPAWCIHHAVRPHSQTMALMIPRHS